ncbi:MAG: hypothetical protein JJ863_06580 [Deltaproteobacteria bacterium]|nr:hypothetical protein [Deltaproteobacteria bacterium]
MSEPQERMAEPSRRFRLFARTWAVAALFHLTLPDVRHLEWLVPDLLLGLSAVALLVRPVAPPRRLGWALWLAGLAGLVWPLLLLGDQLTQSVHLSVMAGAVLICARGSDDRAHAWTVRWATIAVYGIAAFHKLNRDFLNGDVSCAAGGVKLLGENWGWTFGPSPIDPYWPFLFLAAELGLVLLFRLRPRWAIPIALTMHVPLTIVFAPAFAWVMVAGYPCFFDDEGIERLGARLRARWLWVVGVGGTLAAIDATLYFQDHWIGYPAWQISEAGVWLLWAAAWVALGPWSDVAVQGWRDARAKQTGALLLAAFALNALTPYLGLQVHHTAAMLSNVRIDEGCWNHLIVPEAIRLRDPYVRIDHADPAASARGRDELIDHLHDRLWPPHALHESIRDACRHGAAPLALEGRYGGRPFQTPNACTDLPVPPGHPGLFQTNLTRDCPQRCIH